VNSSLFNPSYARDKRIRIESASSCPTKVGTLNACNYEIFNNLAALSCRIFWRTWFEKPNVSKSASQR